MIRVAEHVARSDTGHQRATNEDSHLERAPVFVVADGMGGAQAGEVASQLAVAHFSRDLAGEDGDAAPDRLAQAAFDANAEIYALAEADPGRSGMGTTLTAAYVGASEVHLAHVGDSRAYRLRDSELLRLTEDHSLVEELVRQGRLTEEEAEEHPQRSIITRALGPEPAVEVDLVTVPARGGDVYLLCSDGLTSMVGEAAVGEILREGGTLAATADRLIAAALAAGGRDNVTVILFRLEEVGAGPSAPTEEITTTSRTPSRPTEDAQEPAAPPERVAEPALLDAGAAGATARPPRMPAAARRRAPRMPRRGGAHKRPRRGRRRVGLAVATIVALAVIVVGALLAVQAVYFVGTDSNGQVTIYNGIPYALPAGVRLYTPYFVSGITVAELSPLERGRLFNNQLRSQAAATLLVSQLELGKIAGQ